MRKRKWLIILLAFLFLIPLFVCYPNGIREEPPIETPETDFEWTLYGYSLSGRDGTYRLTNTRLFITGYKGTSSDIVIPKELNIEIETTSRDEKMMFAVPVLGIWEDAFKGRGLTRVVIPEGISYIHAKAFENNNLVSVSLPNTLTRIDNRAFLNNNLESVIIPNGVTVIEASAFARNRLSSVRLPNTLLRIRSGAFENNNLQEITLPDSVIEIGEAAFRNNRLTSITIPENVTEIRGGAFTENPLKEICIKPENFRLLTLNAFNPPLFGVLPPGTYVPGNDRNWLFRDSDGTLLPLQSYYEKLKEDDPRILADFVYVAVKHADMETLRDCISRGADVRGRMLNGQGNTPLAEVISGGWFNDSNPFHNRNNNTEIMKWRTDAAAVLLEAGAVPQYWMLRSRNDSPAIIKMLLEHGALTNPESSEYGDMPRNYKRPESLLLDYCRNLGKRYGGSRAGLNPLITESAALLLEYGEDPNYRDPDTGQTPLSAAMDESVYGTEMAELLLKHVSRPLSQEEYRLLIGLYNEKRNQIWYGDEDMDRDDPFGFNTVVLDDIRNGLLNPETKDSNGKDIFDYAAATGTSDLMRGLLPYLLRSEREIVTANGTGLYIDALNADNIPVATVLSTVMEHRFTAQETSGNTYSLEYYNWDHQTIHLSAQRIPRDSLHRSGPGGFRSIGENPGEISYRPDRFFTAGGGYWDYGKDLTLYTVDGGSANLTAALNEKKEQYYSESGKEMPDSSPNWHTVLLFSNLIYARPYYGIELALVDISGGKTSAYILDTENPPFDPKYIWGAWDFVIDSGQAYLLTDTGDAIVFNVGSHSLHYEKTVPFREIHIPGGKGGDWVFESDGTVTEYNISSGAMRPLEGTPLPAGDYYMVKTFDRGHIYHEKNRQCKTICFFENGILTRKIILSGSAVTGGYGQESIDIHGNTLYMGMRHLAFTVDLDTMQINKAFSTDIESLYSGNRINIFPFGADDIVYSRYFYDGDR